MRIAYISGFTDGMETYEAIYYDGEFFLDSIYARINEMAFNEYCDAVADI